MTEEKPTNAIQESLLALLAFDDEYCKLIRNSTESDLFEGIYQRLAGSIYSFIDAFEEAPKDSLPDIVDTEIEGKDKKQADLYIRTLQNLMGMRNLDLNRDYTIKRLNDFLRGQRLKQSILQAAEIVQEGSSEAIDRAENILENGMNRSLDLFDPGIKFGSEQFVDFLHEEKEEAFPTGIDVLDNKNIGPRRGELFMLAGSTGAGKSLFLLNLAKQAMLQRQKVLYISLEMSSRIASRRFTQALFSFSKHPGVFTRTRFEKDSLDRLIGLEYEEIRDRPSMEDSDFEEWMKERYSKLGKRFSDNFIVKQFPTRQLTVSGLKSYLDSLERMEGFVPDLIALDYVDLMNIDPKNYRLALGSTVEEIRGVGVDRNIAVATVSQANREGIKSQVIRETDLSEDISKAFTVDNLLTFSATEEEEKKGLGRIFVAKARDEEDGFTVLVSQNLALMQFSVESHLLRSDHYWELIKE